MIKKIFLVAMIALVLFNLAGCKKEPTVDADKDSIIVFFSTQAVSASLLKATEPATGDETTISKVIVFGADKDGNFIQNPVTITSPNPNGQAMQFKRRVKTVYAIANPSLEMESFNPTDVTALKGLTADFTNVPETPFLMSGLGEVDENHSAVIRLEKPFAKVEIVGIDFDIATVTVKNTPDKGFVFAGAATLVPGGAGMVNYLVDTPEDYYENSAIIGKKITVYVAENSKLSPTQFWVTGTFPDGTTPINLYNITLQENNKDIDIERNTYYQIIINAKSTNMLRFTKSTF